MCMHCSVFSYTWTPPTYTLSGWDYKIYQQWIDCPRKSMVLVRTWAVMKTTTVNLVLQLSSKQHVMTVDRRSQEGSLPREGGTGEE